MTIIVNSSITLGKLQDIRFTPEGETHPIRDHDVQTAIAYQLIQYPDVTDGLEAILQGRLDQRELFIESFVVFAQNPTGTGVDLGEFRLDFSIETPAYTGGCSITAKAEGPFLLIMSPHTADHLQCSLADEAATAGAIEQFHRDLAEAPVSPGTPLYDAERQEEVVQTARQSVKDAEAKVAEPQAMITQLTSQAHSLAEKSEELLGDRETIAALEFIRELRSQKDTDYDWLQSTWARKDYTSVFDTVYTVTESGVTNSRTRTGRGIQAFQHYLETGEETASLYAFLSTLYYRAKYELAGTDISLTLYEGGTVKFSVREMEQTDCDLEVALNVDIDGNHQLFFCDDGGTVTPFRSQLPEVRKFVVQALLDTGIYIRTLSCPTATVSEYIWEGSNIIGFSDQATEATRNWHQENFPINDTSDTPTLVSLDRDGEMSEEDERECAFAIIKGPSVARGHTGLILDRLRGSGFKILRTEVLSLSHENVRDLYPGHVDRPYYNAVESVMAHPQVCVGVWVTAGKNSIEKLRSVVGLVPNGTECAPGTIRRAYCGAEFGSDPSFWADNAVHVSDTFEDAVREARIVLNPENDPNLKADALVPVIDPSKFPTITEIDVGSHHQPVVAEQLRDGVRRSLEENEIFLSLVADPLGSQTMALSIVYGFLQGYLSDVDRLNRLSVSWVLPFSERGATIKTTVTVGYDQENDTGPQLPEIQLDLLVEDDVVSVLPKTPISTNRGFRQLLVYRFPINVPNGGVLWDAKNHVVCEIGDR